MRYERLLLFIGLFFAACGPAPTIIVDGGPPIISRLYEINGQIRVEWVSGPYPFVVRRFRFNDKGGIWEPEFVVSVERNYYLDDYDLVCGRIYGYVVEDDSSRRSRLRTLKYSGWVAVDSGGNDLK